jgi:uncharacterized membrane protein (Fun14 family)
MIAMGAAIGFAVGHIAQKSFEIVPLLVNDLQVDLLGIVLKCLLAPETFRVRLDVVSVEKADDRCRVLAQDP